MKTTVLAGLLLLPLAAVAAAESTKQSMSFDECLMVINRTTVQLGVVPKVIINSRDVRIVRFPTADGSVLVTCSRADYSMTMTISDSN